MEYCDMKRGRKVLGKEQRTGNYEDAGFEQGGILLTISVAELRS
jgi:hypothetical protein